MYNVILKLATAFWKVANEAYEEFREKVEQLSRENPYPFSEWFDENGRAYIEFQDQDYESPDPGDDKWVIAMLEDAGWQVVDYKSGYAQKGNRKMRIGKIINQIRKDESAKWQSAMEEAFRRGADEFEIENLRRQSEEALEFVESNANQFVNSSARSASAGGGMMIVISQNPHDVASMSTGRSWESCMTLGTGGYHQNVYCEVSRGGLIAYLINANDKNIEHPHARIHIRRFESQDGHNIAIPERSVYGNDVPGFQEAVQNWLNTMQQQMPPGIYERQGGGYSDTFGSTHVVTPEMKVDTPEGQQELVSWVTGERLPPEAKYDQWKVDDLLYDQYGDDDDEPGYARIRNRGAVFMSHQEAEDYVKEQEGLEETDTEREYYGGEDWDDYDEETGEYATDRFAVIKSPVDNTRELQLRAARKLLEAEKGTLSPEALAALKEFSMANSTSYLNPFLKDFIAKYPETLTKEEIDEMPATDNIKFIESLPEDQRAPYLNEWLISINDSLRNPTDIITPDTTEALKELNADPTKNIPTPISGWSRKDSLESDVYMKFMDHIEKPLHLFKTLPEETVQELIQFSNGLPAFGMDPDGKYTNRINDSIMFNFGLKDADS
ncbi:MAG TPA: hypothetical protein VMW42_05560, partial [Desulfatiglandales bacterium]|nr:hypothetical protein [Desulfatiglandales bacterium]